jgi:hypothetical protein
MWPDDASGFEAHPFSPAGRAQASWWFLRRFGRTPSGKWFVRLLALALAGGIVVRPLAALVRAAR